MIKLRIEQQSASETLAESITQGKGLLEKLTDAKNENDLYYLNLDVEGWKEHVQLELIQFFDSQKIAKDFSDWKQSARLKGFAAKAEELRRKLTVNVKALEFLKKGVDSGWYSGEQTGSKKQKPFGPYKQYPVTNLWGFLHRYIWQVSTLAAVTLILILVAAYKGFIRLDKRDGTHIIVKLPDLTEKISDDEFIEKLHPYTMSILRNKKVDPFDGDEHFLVYDVLRTDEYMYVLICRRNEDKGMSWGCDGTHYKSTALVVAIKYDSTIKTKIIERNIYPSNNGCLGVDADGLLAFINYKNDKDNGECEWRGTLTHFPFKNNSKSSGEVFSHINAGFYPYLRQDTVVHLSMYKNRIYANNAITDSSGVSSARKNEHLKKYRDAVFAHSGGIVNNPIGDAQASEKFGNYSDAYERIVDGIRDADWLR